MNRIECSLSKYFCNAKTTNIVFSFVGLFLVIITGSKYGPGLSPDSIAYLATADNLKSGMGFVSFDAKPILEWPPLYSILIFVISFILNLSGEISALLLNSILFGLSIYQTGVLIDKFSHSKTIKIIGILAILFSIPLISITFWVWSELLFITLTLWYFHFLVSYFENQKKVHFLMIIVTTVLASLTRYIGVVLILTTIMALVIYRKEVFKKKIILITIYSLLSAIPILIWIIRNYIVSGTFFGRRGSTNLTFLYNGNLTVNKIISWYIPDYFSSLKLLVILVIAAIFIVTAFTISRKINYKNLLMKFNNRLIGSLFLFTTSYILVLLVLSSTKSFDPINDRLLSPVFIPITLIILFVLQLIYLNISSYKKIKLLFTFILIIALIYPFSNSLKTILNHYHGGSGYSGDLWNKEETRKWLNQRIIDSFNNPVMCSNDPFAVYYLTKTPTEWGPIKAFGGSDELYYHLNDLEGIWPKENETQLIWFDKRPFQQRSVYTPEELSTISEVTLIDSSSIGLVYKINKLKK